jgi:sugar phosphate isomerase/epimerase
VADGIAAVLPYARSAKLPLAIEPLHPIYAPDRAVINTLAQALDLCDALGDGVGVVLDTYHLWWDPELVPQIARAGHDKRILAHHISDFLVPTRDLLNDRGMMGDGVIDFRGFRRAVEAAGFTGPQEVELFSHDWWGKPGDEVISTCIKRYNAVC